MNGIHPGPRTQSLSLLHFNHDILLPLLLVNSYSSLKAQLSHHLQSHALHRQCVQLLPLCSHSALAEPLPELSSYPLFQQTMCVPLGAHRREHRSCSRSRSINQHRDGHESLPHTCFIPEGKSRQETSIIYTLPGDGECCSEGRGWCEVEEQL